MRASMLLEVGFKAKLKQVKLEDFEKILLLGKGTFGKVILARLPTNG